MKRKVKKEQKKFPYRKWRGINFCINEKDSYAIVDEDQNIIEKYRLKCTALQALGVLQEDHKRKLEIVSLRN